MRFLARAWSDLALDPALLARVEPNRDVPLTARTAVGELAADAVAAASLMLGLVGERRTGTAAARVRLDPGRVAATFASERYLRVAGSRVSAFAPLSGFWPTTDGWVRTHANYPHHAARLRSLLGLTEDAEPPAVATALGAVPARALEDRAAQVGAIVAAVRTAAEWLTGAPAQHLVSQPLVRSTPTGSSVRPIVPAGEQPLSGVRVLDLTRVLAGPVATRALAYAGADVLRVDAPQLPEIAWQHLDTGQGKRSTLLDLRTRGDRATFAELLATAHVLVTGYRPDALSRFGLGDDDLAADHPGLVVGRVSAWGCDGPWGGRRGFDSIVQAAVGIADLERGPDGRPGALPAQALDHASGYLLAAGVAAGLADVAVGAPARRVEVALARVGMALLDTAGPPPPVPPAPLPDVTLQEGTQGVVGCAPPAVQYPGAPGSWATVGHRPAALAVITAGTGRRPSVGPARRPATDLPAARPMRGGRPAPHLSAGSRRRPPGPRCFVALVCTCPR